MPDWLTNLFYGSNPLAQGGPGGPYGQAFTAEQQQQANALAQSQAALTAAGGQAAGAIGTGAAPARTLFGTAMPGATTLASALAPGAAAGWGSNILANTPGYQASLNSALQAGQRQANAVGQGQSGGFTAAQERLANQMASQQWQQYIQNLQQQQTAAGGAAGQIGNLYGNLGNIYGSLGQTQAGVIASQAPYGEQAAVQQYVGPAAAQQQENVLGGNLFAGLLGGTLGFGSSGGFTNSIANTAGKGLFSLFS